MSADATKTATSERAVYIAVARQRESGFVGNDPGISAQFTGAVVDAHVQRAFSGPLDSLPGSAESPEGIRRKPMVHL